MRDKLTWKQTQFIEHYCGDCNGNATESARKAGYKGNNVTLRAVGKENLTKPHIKEAVERKKAQIAEKIDVTTDQILNGFLRVAFSEDPNEYTSNKLRALENLGKIRGMYIEKRQEVIPPEQQVSDADKDMLRQIARERALRIARAAPEKKTG